MSKAWESSTYTSTLSLKMRLSCWDLGAILNMLFYLIHFQWPGACTFCPLSLNRFLSQPQRNCAKSILKPIIYSTLELQVESLYYKKESSTPKMINVVLSSTAPQVSIPPLCERNLAEEILNTKHLRDLDGSMAIHLAAWFQCVIYE